LWGIILELSFDDVRKVHPLRTHLFIL
jgi:hypothetical protein